MRFLRSIKGRLVVANTLAIAFVLVLLAGLAFTLVKSTGTAMIDEGLKQHVREIAQGGPGGPPGRAMGPGGGRGRGPGQGLGLGPGMGPGTGPGLGLGLGPRSGPRSAQASQGDPVQPGGPGQGPGRGPGQGPGLAPGQGPGNPPMPQEPGRPFEDLTGAALRAALIRRPILIAASGEILAPQDAPGAWSLDLYRKSMKGEVVTGPGKLDSSILRVASAPVVRDGRVAAVVQVAQDTEGVELAAQSVGRIFLLLAPLALALSAGAAWWLVQSSLAPVDRATQEAEAIAASGDLNRRLPATGSDEISRLSASLNAMLERLKLSFAEERTLRSSLERALETQKRFAGDASHELRTPLTRISLAAENGLFARNSEDKDRALGRIKASAQEMTRLTENLLLLARADAGQTHLKLEELSLAALVAEILEDGPWTSDPRLTVILPSGPTQVLADRASVVRIVSNFLENAFRHTPPEGRVTLGGEIHQSRCWLFVADTGEGIPRDQLAKVGERFFRVEASRERAKGGAGLGLALSRELAEAMNASFLIESEEGAGTRAAVGLLLP